MTSRLDRLFVLLESGSSTVTRKTAAKQLGEVQRLHPHELHSLLYRIKNYLMAASWETRIAGGQAIQAVIENVPKWNPEPLVHTSNEIVTIGNSGNAKKLNLDKFDINSVLKTGAHLTGSEGSEYDVQEKTGQCDISKQRQILSSKIGLCDSDNIGTDIGDLVTAEDLVTPPCDKNTNNFSENLIGEMVQTEISQAGGLSIREKNRARRKARQLISKQSSVESDETDEPKKKKNKVDFTSTIDTTESTPDITGSWGNATHWPFESFCDDLATDLFNPRWESRHGAAIGLREIITCHGEGAGKIAYVSKEQMEEDHELWLQDMSLRVLSVLSLDRFGDFVSDQVVAPVRETCAQVLGAIITLMKKISVEGVLRIVCQLLDQNDWEARHGGLLALKYILAVRKDLVGDILPVILPFVMKRLSDEVDDVSAVAAASLIPVTYEIIDKTPDQISKIISKLWELLLDQDDLAAACNSFMGLLAALLSSVDSKAYTSSQPLSELLPRLWPFLSHNASSVRKSTLLTLKTLTAANTNCIDWNPELLQIAMRHVYQRVLVEPDQVIQDLAYQVWQNLLENVHLNCLLQASCPYFGVWLCLAMQNSKTPFDPSLLIPVDNSRVIRRNGRPLESSEECLVDQKMFLGGGENMDLDFREINSIRARYIATKMLGFLSCYIVKLPPEHEDKNKDLESPVTYYVKVLLTHLNSKSALQRMVCGLVICEWARLQKTPITPPELVIRIHQCLQESVYFDEIGVIFTRLVQDSKDYVNLLKYYKINVEETYDSNILSLDQIQDLTKTCKITSKISKKTFENLEERRKSIFASSNQLLLSQNALNIACQATLAGAVVELKCLPEKLNPVIKPLMESIKKEESEILQNISAQEISNLLELCVERSPCPNNKIISNVCTFLCCDPEYTPRASTNSSDFTSNLNFMKEKWTILTLCNQQRQAERALLKRQCTSGSRGPGRPRLMASEGFIAESLTVDDELHKVYRIQRRGANLALEAIAKRFGIELPTKLPKLWSMLCCHSTVTSNPDDLIMCLQVLEASCLSLHKDLLPQLMTVLPKLCEILTHECNAVRHMSARCIASLAILDTENVMKAIVHTVVPLLAVSENEIQREGAAEAISCVVEKLQFEIIPYVVLLLIPLLGRMSDQNYSVRTICTQSFAALVQLLPLDNPHYDTDNLSAEKEKERSFLRYLLNPKSIPDFKVPMPIKAELRPYQQAGINWLAFLNKYKLHGILCDDMGLGKTLQSICILASDHFHRQQEYMKKKSPDCKPLPSLVICPPTLTGHWVYEVEKFLSKEYLNPLQYSGPPLEREKLKSKIGEYNLIVASYDIVRKDIEFFKSIKWNYCILDEGHIIKNGKTKVSKAIKTLTANHRLILSGTPIQNNVLELWSLFDFLMPGLLSTEKQFNAKYSKPILASRDPKSSQKEQEAGVIAMESLHRQVLPFLLRRMKEDVLKDLPPKITQDYICELSSLQEELYEDFSRTEAHQSLRDSLAKSSQSNVHIFQALRYLQNVCNHPKLVLTKNHPEYERVMAKLASQGTSVHEIQHACKLPALKQLLLDSGIGSPAAANDMVFVNHHRALIFCQLKSMLDIIETDLLANHLPNVSYLRLDGTVPPSQRYSIVNKFNNDPSIDVLLLTTQVGGLGLNLTGADTVIFVEHDWNPMKDLQAMDRAHRIGQKKVVNVYRLITRGTLEEKIMGLQKFKLFTANTIISNENGSMETMATDQLLDLFTLKESENKSGNMHAQNMSNLKVPGIPMKSLLDSLPELWEQQLYEKEFDLTTFMSNLNKSRELKIKTD